MEDLVVVLQAGYFNYMIVNKLEKLDVSLGLFHGKSYVIIVT